MRRVVLTMVTTPSFLDRRRAHATSIGSRVWANPRAVVAMMRQCNTVDVTRRSPSYEVRLAKYSGRAFEVYVPTLKREEIDPTVSSFFFLYFRGRVTLITGRFTNARSPEWKALLVCLFWRS